jgi:hypothetical protein
MKKNSNGNEKKKKNDRNAWKKNDVYVVLKRKRKVNRHIAIAMMILYTNEMYVLVLFHRKFTT